MHALRAGGRAGGAPVRRHVRVRAGGTPARGSCWLVRDRFGTKPLHVQRRRPAWRSGRRCGRCARCPAPSFPIDRYGIVRQGVPWVCDAPPPPFLGVEDVGPGEAWRLGPHGTERRVWCDLVAEVDPARIVEGAREPLEAPTPACAGRSRRSCARTSSSDAPVAAFTSGGVDSNLVAAIALELRPDLVAYTMDSGGPESELAAATLAARHLRLPLRPVRVDRETFLRAWPEAVEREEFPSGHESHVAALVLARAARADGIAVALTGEGSDEAFGGYDFFLRTWKQWAKATRPWSRWTHAGRSRRRELEAVPFRYQTMRSERESHRRFEAWLTPSEDARARTLLARFAPVGPWRDRAVLANGVDAMRRYLGRILMRHDRVSMAASIEARVPFVSNRLADVGLHLPLKYKLRGRVGKWLLKRVAAERLPREIVYARKKGFPVNARPPPRLLRAAAATATSPKPSAGPAPRPRSCSRDRGRPRAPLPAGQRRALRSRVRARRAPPRPRGAPARDAAA